MLARRELAPGVAHKRQLPTDDRTADPRPRRRSSRADALCMLLVWVLWILHSFFVEPQYDQFSNAELIYYSIYNVAIGASVGFYLLDAVTRVGVPRFVMIAGALILGGTLINEALVEPFGFATGPINWEGVYYGLTDALTAVGVFVVLRLAGDLSTLRQRIVDAVAARRVTPSPGCFFVRVSDETRRIYADDVLYIQAERDFARIVCRNGEHFVSENLKTLVERCAEFGIVRIHKSFAVNLSMVERLTRREALVGSVRVPVGRRYWETFADDWRHRPGLAEPNSADLSEPEVETAKSTAHLSRRGNALVQ